MKIAVDLRTVTFGETGGLTQWLGGALEHLIRLDPENEYLVFGMPYNYHLVDVKAPNLRRFTLSTGDYPRMMQDRLDFEGDVRVLIRCLPSAIDLNFPVERQIVRLPDRLHENGPHGLSEDAARDKRRLVRYYQAMAGAIATLTEHARSELLACPWTHCKDVFLMPPALPEAHAEPEDAETAAFVESLLPEAPYFLYPANLWPHKNHRLLLEAFHRFHREHGGVYLLLTGYRDGWADILGSLGRLPLEHLGYVPGRTLAALYRRAMALLYLPTYEGFGLPLLEAFAAGIPVLCSDRPGLAEVGGDAVLRCDPGDPKTIAEGMARIALDAPLRRLLVERGRQRLPAYSWRSSAAALKAAIGRVDERAKAQRSWAEVAPPPVVSIVTPSYNQGRYLRETIESVLSQDYPHIDYRVVDGGSTDETVKILESYGGRFPWVSEKDNGQTHAINKGLALAKGQIQAYLNSDDILRPGAVSKVVEHFRKKPACDLVYGRDAYIDPDGNYLGWFPTAPYSFERLIEDCCISQPAAFWRDRIAKAAGPFDESLYSIMDYEYWMRLDRAGALIEHLPHMLASTRMHSEAKTSGGEDYQARRFREVFTSAIKHSGGVSKIYLGHWLDAFVYRRWPWLRRFPKTTAQAGRFWVKYRDFYGCRPIGAAARTAEEMASYLLPVPKFSLVTAVREKFRPRRADITPGPNYPRQRWGPRLHNFMGNRVVVSAAIDRGVDELRLAGRSPVDMTLSLSIGGERLAEVPLKALELTDLRVPCRVTRDDTRVITLEFSATVWCPVRGAFSFELLGTNLFGEKYLG